MAFDQRLLHRMQGAVGLLQVFHGKQSLAVQRRGELDAGIDRFQLQLAVDHAAQHHGAGAAIAFGAAFLGAGAVQVFAQVLQHSLRWGSVSYFMHGAAVVKADRF